MPKTFGAKLKAAREARNLRQEEIGGLIGVTAARVSQWERGDTCRNPKVILDLVEQMPTMEPGLKRAALCDSIGVLGRALYGILNAQTVVEHERDRAAELCKKTHRALAGSDDSARWTSIQQLLSRAGAQLEILVTQAATRDKANLDEMLSSSTGHVVASR